MGKFESTFHLEINKDLLGVHSWNLGNIQKMHPIEKFEAVWEQIMGDEKYYLPTKSNQEMLVHLKKILAHFIR